MSRSAAVVALALAACASPTVVDGPGEEHVRRRVVAECTSRFAAGCPPDYQGSADVCVQNQLVHDHDQSGPAIDRGAILVDEAMFDACLASYVCGQATGTACTSAFVGTVPLGGGCELDAACVAGTYCYLDPDTLSICGTCLDQRVLGERCNASHECLGFPEVRCAGLTTTETGTCATVSGDGPAAAVGSICGVVPTAATTAAVVACVDGWCSVPFAATIGACTAFAPEGADCGAVTPAVECGPGLHCSRFAGVAQCVPNDAVAYLGRGEACDPDSTVFCDPVAGLTCRGGVCAPLGGNGDDCQAMSFLPACVAGLHCDPITAHCRGPQALGGTCLYDSDCASGLCGYFRGCVTAACD